MPSVLGHLVQSQRKRPGDAISIHRDPVNRIGDLNGPAIVRDHDELGPLRQSLHRVHEAANVRLVQRSIHLIENAEGRGVDGEQREKECHCSQRALATGEQRQALDLLAGRLGFDLDAGFRRV